MKAILSFVLVSGLVSNAFAQSGEVLAFNQQPIEVQATMVKSAKAELGNLELSLDSAKTQKRVYFALGITSATISVLTGLMSGLVFKNVSTFSGDLQITFKVIGTGLGAVAGGSGYLAYKSFKWYGVKADEVEKLLNDLRNARIATEAADRAYDVLLNNG